MQNSNNHWDANSALIQGCINHSISTITNKNGNLLFDVQIIDDMMDTIKHNHKIDDLIDYSKMVMFKKTQYNDDDNYSIMPKRTKEKRKKRETTTNTHAKNKRKCECKQCMIK